MNQQIAAPRFRISRALQNIFSSYAVSNETLIGVAVPLLLSNLLLDFGREPGSFGTWLVISFCGYLAMLIIPVSVRLFFARAKLHMGVYALMFLAAGFLRGATIYTLARESNVIGPGELQYRIFGSALFVFVALSLVTVVVANSVRATKEFEELETSRRALEQRLSSMRTEITRLNSEVAGQVSGLISPVIQQLMQNLKGAKASELGSEIKALRATVDEVIRPLSLTITAANDELRQSEVDRAKVSLREDFKLSTTLLPANQILPFWSTLLIVLISTPAAFSFYAKDGFLALLSFALSSFVSLELAVVVLRRIQMKVIPALFLQVALFAVSGYLSAEVLDFLNFSSENYSMIRIILLSVIIGVAVFIGQLRQTHRESTRALAAEINLQLEYLNSQARRELWINRRRIATILHGPVQAALYASAMRLAQAVRPSRKLIQSVNADLENALEVLKFDSVEATNLRDVLRQIVDVWAGTCEIYLNISKNVLQSAKNNPLLAEALVEVLREAVSNAIKHGQATEIEVEAKVSGEVIEVSILNNGKAPVNQAGNGFGSKLYDELTHSWGLNETADGRTRFSATIFIA